MSVATESTDDSIEIPEHIAERTEAMVDHYPPTNPNVVLETAQWWYNNGKGSNDPVYEVCIAWLAKLISKRDEDVFTQGRVFQSMQHYDKVREYLEEQNLDASIEED